MVARMYAGTPADFVIDVAAKAAIVDAAGAPVDPAREGWVAVLPDTAVEFDVYDIESTQYTDLLDNTGTPASTVSSSASFTTVSQMLTFTVNGAPDGDVYLVATGGTPFVDPTFRMTPLSSEIFERLLVLELRGLADLPDVDPSDIGDDKFVKFDSTSGLHVYATPAGSGTVTTVAGIAPIDGDVPLTRDDLDAASDTVVQEIASNYRYLIVGDSVGYAAPLGTGIPDYAGPVDPGADRVGKVWYQPEST